MIKMPEEIHTLAHGKVLWLGGYSILEKPNIGYVTTVDAGVHAYFQKRESSLVSISVPQFEQNAEGTIDSSTGDIKIETTKELLLVKTTIKVASSYAAAFGYSLSGFSLRTLNDPAFSYRVGTGTAKLSKSGLGSSAAVTVAVADAIFKAFGVSKSENDALHKIAQISHSLATGKIGSGFDIAAATYGDIVYSRYSPEFIESIPMNFSGTDIAEAVKKKWDYQISPLPLPKAFSFSMANFVDDAAITTKMVGSVKEFKRIHESEYSKLITDMNEQNKTAIDALRIIQKDSEDEDALSSFRDAFNKGRQLSKELGIESKVPIEPDDITDLIQGTVKNGAFVAKSPGAGGYDAIVALFRSVDGDVNQNRVSKFWEQTGKLQPLEVGPSKLNHEQNRKKKLAV